MMKPKFEDLLEYVRGGEKDPRIGKMVKLDQDVAEQLQQARAMFELLGHTSDITEPPTEVFEGSVSYLKANDMPEMDVAGSFGERAMDSQTYLADRKAHQIAKAISDRGFFGSRLSTMGTLRMWVESKWILVSLETGKQTEDEMIQVAGAGFVSKSAGSSADAGGSEGWEQKAIQVSSHGMLVSMDDRHPLDEGVRFRVSNASGRIPLRAENLVYVPQRGPFVRLTTDSKGVATLPMPSESGALRIDGEQTEIITIKLRK